jgi:hypothetical protein
MNRYLLLRDNKQTGPYSAEELIQKGFKAYDLIWIDGKSAGWRYPGELPEFASHAPMVEEQPFDRFYKKPSNRPAAEKPEEPVRETPVIAVKEVQPARVIPLTTKKVFVTLPQTAAVRSQSQPVQYTEPSPPVRNDTPPSYPDPVYARATVQSAAAKTSAAKTPVKTEGLPEKSSTSSPLEASTPSLFTGRSLALRAAIAVCLLLGGVIIGLLISSGKTEAEQEKLAQRLEALRSKQEISATPAPPETETVPAAAGVVIPAAPLPQPVTEALDKKPVTQTVVYQEPEKPLPAPTGTEPEKEKLSPPISTDKNLPAPEPIKPRENLYPLVKLSASPYKTGVLGGISGLQLTITNNSLHLLDEVAVQIKYLGPEKRVIRTEVILVRAVEAGQQKTVDVPKSSRGVTVETTIIRISAAATAQP